MTEQSRAYAEAVYALAAEAGQQKTYLEGLRTAQKLIFDEPEYVDLLASPAISQQERASLLEQAMGDILPEQVLSFLQILCAHDQIRILPDCIEEYERLYQITVSVSTAYVTSAVVLSDEEKALLQKKLEKISGHTVIMDCRVDKTLLGGMTVQMDGKVMDGSLRHRLHEVKEVMQQ